jgi:hypothetical protein
MFASWNQTRAKAKVQGHLEGLYLCNEYSRHPLPPHDWKQIRIVA